MSKNAVMTGASYILVHGPDFIIHNGTTQTTERLLNPESEYLAAVPKHLRSYESALSYPPNQVYIGNITPDELADYEFPWYDKEVSDAARYGRFGEIMPQDEFIGLLKICDVFDLVALEKEFAGSVKEKLSRHPLIGEEMALPLSKCQEEREQIETLVNEHRGEGLYHNDELVGAVRRAHDIDQNLSAHVMLENLVSKASNVLSLLHLVKVSGKEPSEIDYVIDCCEEAIGDMNQRGGGNLAKAAAEIAGLVNATGSDTRSFCAAPAHAIIEAAALVKSGAYRNVVVTAGGSTAKLGMNGKDHIKKGLPILEDVVAGFSVLISENDGINPEFNLDYIGRHKVGTGSSPQAVISSLVTEPLERAGLSIADVDKYAAEMQNPDVTRPAGAGDVPEANYKMIAALGVRQGALERSEIAGFVKNHGMTGWAPTQGHIPSGVPYLGFAKDRILSGEIKRVMIVGKGSLFLGRMTNLFDGVSFMLQENSGEEKTEKVFKTRTEDMPIIGVAAEGSETNMDNILEGIAIAKKKGFKAIVIEGDNVHKKMEEMISKGEIDGAVTMHYPFPIGVSTVGRVVTPAMGKEMYIATTTGMTATDRVESMIRNAVCGIAAAKSCGVEKPTVGIANVDGARQTEKALLSLKEGGYEISFAESKRSDGGFILRGNDLLTAAADIVVMDPLTGNLMMKVFSAFNTGGNYEATGYGYGPGTGENFDKTILIVSRVSGAPVIAGAIEYATELLKSGFVKVAANEFDKANRAGLKKILSEMKKPDALADAKISAEVKKPPREVVTAEIPGIEVMDIEDAATCLWKEGIYAETGMGCTGPVVLVSEANEVKAQGILSKTGYIK
ncbi:MAG TPA: glycine/sarcosine/betaine reductase complex component C subunit beta [Anaerovoracaceae bacterium]|nr:glycine/sarcosine/betaine reductase complex component C subunit beta [Anaerovoracaceae bacterium]